ncbi:Domain of unknown function (DUF336) [Seminavis robusta]|uniref:Heme-binding protein n=1 Tax=Seminavis robusta TaxID=568900 RepID=A0A9N8H7N6_9STRA|nr:Domain of unknown function (DUF336) [Seminavis robusta]|eukprot:Sro72_g039760.1 Domain of unknown function (DUF336) (261) ;mRNA; r:32393-33175
MKCSSLLTLTALSLVLSATRAQLPDYETLTSTLQTIVAEENGGFGFHMWASIVDRDGTVLMVARSGEDRGDQWPGSRVISAQKANTANAFSLPGLALSTANLYYATQSGQSLFGLQLSNPVDTSVAYGGSAERFGTQFDPMIGKRIGGVNVFGGGLALYDSTGEVVGAIGVSGDSSVADHIIAWKLRDALDLDYIPGGVSPTGDDNMVLDLNRGESASGWGHPSTTEAATEIVGNLPEVAPVGVLLQSRVSGDEDFGQIP